MRDRMTLSQFAIDARQIPATSATAVAYGPSFAEWLAGREKTEALWVQWMTEAV
jgi:hypothetical protein